MTSAITNQKEPEMGLFSLNPQKQVAAKEYTDAQAELAAIGDDQSDEFQSANDRVGRAAGKAPLRTQMGWK